MKFISNLLIICFFSVAIFASLALYFQHLQGRHMGCLADFANGATCPLTNSNNALAFSFMHFLALKSLSTAVFSTSVLQQLVILSLFLVFSIWIFKISDISKIKRQLLLARTEIPTKSLILKSALNWLSILEKRDPVNFSRTHKANC